MIAINEDGECNEEGDWYRRGDTCYKWFETAKNFDSAKDSCLQIGGKLAIIDDEDQVLFLQAVSSTY